MGLLRKGVVLEFYKNNVGQFKIFLKMRSIFLTLHEFQSVTVDTTNLLHSNGKTLRNHQSPQEVEYLVVISEGSDRFIF